MIPIIIALHCMCIMCVECTANKHKRNATAAAAAVVVLTVFNASFYLHLLMLPLLCCFAVVTEVGDVQQLLPTQCQTSAHTHTHTSEETQMIKTMCARCTTMDTSK